MIQKTSSIPNITIREARKSDFDALLAGNIQILKDTDRLSHFNEFEIREGLIHSLLCDDRFAPKYYVAEIDDRIAGQLMVQPEIDDFEGLVWWIKHVHTDSKFRRQGIFSALYSHVESKANKAGVTKLKLFVVSSNQMAQTVYNKLGFDAVGIRMSKKF